MAKRYVTVDDLTGRETDTSEVKVTVGGEEATLDLSPESLAALEALVNGKGPEALAKLFEAPSNGSNGSKGNGSKTTRSTGTGGGKGGSGRAAELPAIRAWANETGYTPVSGKKLSTHGRVPADVIAAYDAAHGK